MKTASKRRSPKSRAQWLREAIQTIDKLIDACDADTWEFIGALAIVRGIEPPPFTHDRLMRKLQRLRAKFADELKLKETECDPRTD